MKRYCVGEDYEIVAQCWAKYQGYSRAVLVLLHKKALVVNPDAYDIGAAGRADCSRANARHWTIHIHAVLIFP